MEEQTHYYTKAQLENILNGVVNRTLGEVDKNNVFDKTLNKPKITGIAGDVIEESVLGYPSDNRQQPDIIVDNLTVEVKTTGIRRNKKTDGYQAKEPMSITAVSPKKIVHEEFENSAFWHKIERILLVLYLYNSDKPVPSWDYANFPILGYDFLSPNKSDVEKLKNDWEIVRDFIREVQVKFKENPESQYPRISTDLRKHLMLIDTAPKYPNPPRFRFKRATVDKIIQEALGKTFEKLPEEYNSFEEFDNKLSELTSRYKNKTVSELNDLLNVNAKLSDKTGDFDKSISEKIILKMFSSNASSMQKVDIFAEAGIIGKSIVLSPKGGRTEDTKFFGIDFEEIQEPNLRFESSQFHDYFSQNQFLFIVFEEQNFKDKLMNNQFVGFKRLTFSEEFINNEVRIVWNEIRDLVNNNKLKETQRRKKDGTLIINKTGIVSTEINFPKSSSYEVFVRGSGIDSTKKPLHLNGIDMYQQYIWIKGIALVKRLSGLEYV